MNSRRARGIRARLQYKTDTDETNGGSQSLALMRLAHSHRVVSASNTTTVAEDLRRRAPAREFTATPPKNLSSRIVWIQFATFPSELTITSGGARENNFTFQVSDNSSIAGILAFYDQYAIHSVVVDIACPANVNTSSGSGDFGVMVSAIDYDNVNSLSGAFQTLNSYNSANDWEIMPGTALQRVVTPCVSLGIENSGGSVAPLSTGRRWLDNVQNNIPHFGLRTIISSNTVGSYQLDVIIHYVVALRNNI